MLNKLQEKVLLKFQAPVSTAKDCTLLAEQILATTNRVISETTLRRFFGLLKSKSQLSKYNLDTLAIYCGYPDYDHFVDSLPNGKKPVDFLNEFARITKSTLNSIKKKSLTPFALTIPRLAVNKDLDAFIASATPVYTMVAPGGYGKSTTLAHWVMAQLQDEHPVLFVKAAILLSFIRNTQHTSSQLFGLKSKDNAFNQWQAQKSQAPLILIIDAWEELNPSTDKQEHLVAYMNQVIEKYADTIALKIILSLRSTTWQQLFKDQKPDKRNHYQLAYQNLPLFTNEEIRTVVEKYNSKNSSPIVYESILWDTLELLKIPFNLFLFTNLHAQCRIDKSIGYNQLLGTYIKVNVFEAKYAEAMEDILWTLIAHFNKGNNITMDKKALKEQFPIHIKRETSYYNAYAELLSNSILEEERIVNKYGLYTTIVQFKHQNYLHYFMALDIIRQHDGLDQQVFNDVIWSKKNWGWKANIIATLFEIAYNSENFEAIKDFCELPDIIHDSLHVRFTVGQALRKDNAIRNQLIKQFARSEKGRAYYFEQFVDTNYLYNNYVFRIKEYLKNKSTAEARLFGYSILFLASFLKLEKQECLNYKKAVDVVKIDSGIHPWPIGRKVATDLMYAGFIAGEGLQEMLDSINKYKSLAATYQGYFNQGLVTFEMPILVPLVLLNQHEALEALLTDTIKSYNTSTAKNDFVSLLSYNQNVLPKLVLEYARFKQGKEYDKSFNQEVESVLINFSNSYDDFQYQILLRWILFDYYRHLAKPAKAKTHHTAALQLSEFAGYDFFTLFLEVNGLGQSDTQVQETLNEIERKGFVAAAFRK